jgi:hypothetical protein
MKLKKKIIKKWLKEEMTIKRMKIKFKKKKQMRGRIILD